MYDLRVVVDEVKGFCDLPMRPGDYFEVKGGRIIIPEGKYMCLWALQSLMPLLPLKQRKSSEENDWVPRTSRMCCPDPNGMVIYRIETIDPKTRKIVEPSSPINDKFIPRMHVNSDKCTGCRACETICSFKHTDGFCGEDSRIRVKKLEEDGIDKPHICHQCGNAPCIEVCPTEALSKHPGNGSIVINDEKCIGCKACSQVCPFNSIFFNKITGKVLICDLCGGEPTCVKRCQAGAITFGNE